MNADSSAYLESWSQELKARQDRVRLLIGDAHWLSDGHHKEAIIREFLVRHLPAYVRVSRGFIKSPRDNERCSPELDVLISDPSRHVPLFFEGDLAIVPPTSTIAHLHIKTRFDRRSLAESLVSLGRAQRVVGTSFDPSRVWRCICFFDCDQGETSSAAASMVAEELGRVGRVIIPDAAAATALLDLMPTCIVVMARFLGFVTKDAYTEEPVLKWFEAGDLSLACAVADLFATVSARLTGSTAAELDQMIASFPIGQPVVSAIPRAS